MVDSFEGSLRRGEFKKNTSKYHLGKLNNGGFVLTDSDTGKTWKAPLATRYIENCCFHFETIESMLEKKTVFILDIIWKNGIVLQEVGDLMNCNVLIGAWWCPSENDPFSLVDQISGLRPLTDGSTTQSTGECPNCKYSWGRTELIQGFGCGHFFHMCCLRNKWFRKYVDNYECPVCMVNTMLSDRTVTRSSLFS